MPKLSPAERWQKYWLRRAQRFESICRQVGNMAGAGYQPGEGEKDRLLAHLRACYSQMLARLTAEKRVKGAKEPFMLKGA